MVVAGRADHWLVWGRRTEAMEQGLEAKRKKQHRLLRRRRAEETNDYTAKGTYLPTCINETPAFCICSHNLEKPHVCREKGMHLVEDDCAWLGGSAPHDDMVGTIVEDEDSSLNDMSFVIMHVLCENE